MDDVNRRFLEAQRAAALERRAKLEAEPAPRQAETAPARAPDPEAPEGVGRLVLERRQGEWRYTLLERRVRVGDPLEFYVDARIGWVRGAFHWGRRNTSEPRIRVPVMRPDDARVQVGEMEVALPEGALLRWPTGSAEE